MVFNPLTEGCFLKEIMITRVLNPNTITRMVCDGKNTILVEHTSQTVDVITCKNENSQQELLKNFSLIVNGINIDD